MTTLYSKALASAAGGLTYLAVANYAAEKSALQRLVIFFVLILAVMWTMAYFHIKEEQFDLLLAVKYSIYSALIFYLVSSRDMFELTRSVDNRLSNNVVHAVVYALVVLGMMYLPNKH